MSLKVATQHSVSKSNAFLQSILLLLILLWFLPSQTSRGPSCAWSIFQEARFVFQALSFPNPPCIWRFGKRRVRNH